MVRAYCIISLLLAVAGCSGTATSPDVLALVDDAVDISGGVRSGYEEYGFGPVLTRGQTLRHEFTFSNNSKQPIRLVRATASTPCCSAIGPLPTNAIPPGGRCQIPAILKVLTNQKEKKRVVFNVETDSRDQPTLMYALTADFCPEWEVGDVGDRPPALAVNRAGHHVIRVVSRRVGLEGESLPERVEAESPLAAKFIGEPRTTGSGGLTSSYRDVEISLPATAKPGACRGAVVFYWPDGRKRACGISWQVASPLQVVPRSLALNRSESDWPQTIVLSSFDHRPFRITKVGPEPLVTDAEFRPEPRPTHTLKLHVDWASALTEKDPTVTIETDQADEPAIPLPVFIISTKG